MEEIQWTEVGSPDEWPMPRTIRSVTVDELRQLYPDNLASQVIDKAIELMTRDAIAYGISRTAEEYIDEAARILEAERVTGRDPLQEVERLQSRVLTAEEMRQLYGRVRDGGKTGEALLQVSPGIEDRKRQAEQEYYARRRPRGGFGWDFRRAVSDAR